MFTSVLVPRRKRIKTSWRRQPACRAEAAPSLSVDPMPIFELDPVDDIALVAVGQPGQRQFFLLAKGKGRTLTLTCEKAQIQALILRLHPMMETQGIEVPDRPPRKASLAPGEPEWQVGEMGLGYHEARKMFVLVASQAAASEEASA